MRRLPFSLRMLPICDPFGKLTIIVACCFFISHSFCRIPTRFAVTHGVDIFFAFCVRKNCTKMATSRFLVTFSFQLVSLISKWCRRPYDEASKLRNFPPICDPFERRNSPSPLPTFISPSLRSLPACFMVTTHAKSGSLFIFSMRKIV